MQDAFDVFFSYHWRDHAAVERIARALIDRSVSVFLDRWYLAPGQPWPQALEAALGSCRAVAVFLGPDGLGPWQQREKDLALDRQGREPGFPVIPVLLTCSDPGLGFLKLNTWVDFSVHGQADARSIEILIAAIRGEPPGPGAGQRIESARATICPYRGLRPFREEDEPFFFGRATFTETLATTLTRQSFTAVVGASGSGKSSVVRAGLIPRLRRGEGGRMWEAIRFVPTDRPLASLAASLLPLLEPDLTEVDRLAEVGKLARHLAEGEVHLRDVTSRILANQPGTERLLLFADQWEELYTLCPDEALRTAFVAQLLAVAQAAAVTVVLTLRGDFYGRALSDRALSDRLQDAVVNIGPMTRDELAETITRPAEKMGLAFEPGLVETILDDVGDEPGSLPLLEFLLETLWKERRGAVLHYDAYQTLGRVAGAIAHRAEEVFERGLTEAERQVAQRLLIRMVRPGEGVEDTRRRAVIPKADPVAEAIIRKLADARLLVTERDAATGRETVEVAHEALIRGWQRLRGWVDQDREFLRTRERIAADARLWEDEGRPPDRLLPPGRPLAEGEDLLATRRADLEPPLVAFIEAAAAAAHADEEATRASQQRRMRRVRLVATAMAVLALVAISGGAVAWWQRGEAQHNAEEARRNAETMQRNESRALAALANIEAEKGSPATAVRVALAALPASMEGMGRPYVPEAENALYRSLRQLREVRRFLGHEDSVYSVAFSPDGLTVVTASEDKTARLWEVASGHEITTVRGHEDAVLSAAFSPDGRIVVTGSGDKTARLWEVASGREIATLRGHQDAVWSAAFSPDGRTVVTGSRDKTARLWDVASGKEIATLRGHQDAVSSAAFSPDGRTVVTGSLDKTARLWEVVSGREITTLRGHEAFVSSAAFSPDGRIVVTSSWDKTGRLWEVTSGKEIGVLRGHEDAVNSSAFSPDGRTVVTGSRDKTARLWEVASGREIATLRGHQDAVWSAAFNPDGHIVATGSRDKAAQLWEVALGKEIGVLRGHEDAVNSSGFSPDGRIVVTGSGDKTARLWEVASGREIATLRGHQDAVWSVTFSPDGRTVATGSRDKTARLWEVASGREIATLRGHQDAVSFVAFSPDGRTVATGSRDKTARLWEVASGREIATLRGHQDAVSFVAFSPDGRAVVTGGWDETALWDVISCKEIAVLRGYRALAVAFSPDGRTAVVTGAEDWTAKLWEVASGLDIAVLRGHDKDVGSAAFSPDGRTVVTGSADYTARLWEATSGKEIAVLRGHDGDVSSVAFSPDGRTLVTGSWDRTARLWPVGQGLLDLACARIHYLPLSVNDKQRFGIEREWCTPELSARLAAELRLGKPETLNRRL